MLAATIFLVIILLAFVWWFVKARVPKNFPPGGHRWPLPIVGDAPFLGTDMFIGFEKLHAIHGPIVGVTLGPFRLVSISDFDLLKKAMMLDSLQGRAPADPITSVIGLLEDNSKPGVIFTQGSNWSNNRRSTLHHLRNLGFGKSGMDNKINEEVLEFTAHLKNINGEPTEVRSLFNVAVLNALWLIVAGKRLEYNNPKVLLIVNSIYKFLIESTSPAAQLGFQNSFFNTIFEGLGLYDLTGPFQLVKDFSDEAIEEHLTNFDPDDDSDFVQNFINEAISKNVDGKMTSDDRTNLRTIIMDLVLGGTDTTNITLSWAFLFLVTHQDVQKKLRAELDSVSNDSSRLVTIEDRPNTPYAEACIMEIQRAANIFPGSAPHAALTDLTFEGYYIPKGTLVQPFIGSVMQNPKDFPNPSKFDPERFLDSKGNFVPNPKVIPFGIGKRRCLGETLAKTSLYRFITGIVQQFDIVKANKDDKLTLDKLNGSPYPQHYKIRFTSRA